MQNDAVFKRVVVYRKACCTVSGEATQTTYHGKKHASAVFVGVFFVPEHRLCAVERLEVVAIVASNLHEHEGSDGGVGCRKHVVVLAVDVAQGVQCIQHPLCEVQTTRVCANDRLAEADGQGRVGEELDALAQMEGDAREVLWQAGVGVHCGRYDI